MHSIYSILGEYTISSILDIQYDRIQLIQIFNEKISRIFAMSCGNNSHHELVYHLFQSMQVKN